MSTKTSSQKNIKLKLKNKNQIPVPSSKNPIEYGKTKTPLSEKELRQLIIGVSSPAPKTILRKVQELVDAVHSDKEAVKRDEVLWQKSMSEVSRMLSLDTKCNLKSSVEGKDIALAIEMSRELEKEYGVTTATEKALVQIAVAAYCRFHACSSLFYCNYAPQIHTPQWAQYISIYAKEIDRAHRQFITAIQALKQLKSPELKVHLTAKTAFVAQNQQNVSNGVSQINPENNEAQ